MLNRMILGHMVVGDVVCELNKLFKKIDEKCTDTDKERTLLALQGATTFILHYAQHGDFKKRLQTPIEAVDPNDENSFREFLARQKKEKEEKKAEGEKKKQKKGAIQHK